MVFHKPSQELPALKPLSSTLLNSLRETVEKAQKQFSTTAGEKSPSAKPSASDLSRAATSGALSGPELARLIDHTLLKADARAADFEKLCREARAQGFATVCVNGSWIPFVAEKLAGSSVKPIAVVGFPLGAGTSSAKVWETLEAVSLGAQEIDMVLAVGRLKEQDHLSVFEDIRLVVEAAKPAPVKVILETCLLSTEEKIAGCVLAKMAGAAFVKTSTGFGVGGATVEDIALMRAVVGPEMGVKASGGIRTREDALRMIAAGATRIGASASVAIATAQAGGDEAKGY